LWQRKAEVGDEVSIWRYCEGADSKQGPNPGPVCVDQSNCDSDGQERWAGGGLGGSDGID